MEIGQDHADGIARSHAETAGPGMRNVMQFGDRLQNALTRIDVDR